MIKGYFEWLCSQVGPTANNYHKLLLYLHSRPFYWVIPEDRNRAEDAYAMRRDYIEDFDISDESQEGDASVLEVLIALSKRIDADIMWDETKGDQSSHWFWLMISNLGLNYYNDNHMNYEQCSEVVDNFMQRNYGRNGSGSLFPRPVKTEIIRKEEIWDQLNLYFENCL